VQSTRPVSNATSFSLFVGFFLDNLARAFADKVRLPLPCGRLHRLLRCVPGSVCVSVSVRVCLPSFPGRVLGPPRSVDGSRRLRHLKVDDLPRDQSACGRRPRTGALAAAHGSGASLAFRYVDFHSKAAGRGWAGLEPTHQAVGLCRCCRRCLSRGSTDRHASCA